MRCIACNKILTEKEDSRIAKESGERIGLCDEDFSFIEDVVEVVVNETLPDFYAPKRNGLV